MLTAALALCAWAMLAEGRRLGNTFPLLHAAGALAPMEASAPPRAPPVLGGPVQPAAEAWLGAGGQLRGRGWVLSMATSHHEPPQPTLREIYVDSGLPLRLPTAWAESLEASSAKKIHEGAHSSLYLATLAADPDAEVAISVMRSWEPGNQRELHLLERMRLFHDLGFAHSGHTVEHFDTATVGGTSFVLMEKGAAGRPLWHSLRDREVQWPGEEEHTIAETPGAGAKGSCGNGKAEKAKGQWSPWNGMPMPLEESLPVLVDILRGVRDLEDAGIIHASLTPLSVVMDDDDRALIRDLCFACLHHDGEPSLRCDVFQDQRNRVVGSLLFQSPEVEDGKPTGPENHVWSVGIMFAHMCLGYIPTKRAVMMNMHPEERNGEIALSDPRYRENIRGVLRNSFSIESDPSYSFLHAGVRRVLSGMLAKRVGARWSTSKCLKEVEKLAKASGVSLPEARKPPSLPPPWPQATADTPSISTAAALVEGVYSQGLESWQ
mmetsp:Transcript_56968/g.165088  ORF Transcript_56968/g.165088 Transcript_56968/m.165088 type:complete len:492 (-) Transcript_56968:128-1603(-)